MDLKEKIDELCKKIDKQGDSVKFRCSAYDWYKGVTKSTNDVITKCTFDSSDQILQRAMDSIQRLSERRRKEIEITILELICNSVCACGEKPDLYLEYEIYTGSKGLVCYLRDDGPGFDHQTEVEKRKDFMRQVSGFKDYDKRVLAGSDLTEEGGGAGIYCLLRYANEFHYSDKGNEIVVRFGLRKRAPNLSPN